MLRIAITGGIGSGKSLACSYIESRGFTVIYADKMAREITAPGGKAIPYIRKNFGDDYILEDGSLDRAKMRELVYSNPDAMRLLEEGTTKVVAEDIKRIIEYSERMEVRALFFEIPLLFEKNAQDEYDQVWLVTAGLEKRVERVMERDGLSREQVISIMHKQIPEEKKLDMSDEAIYNEEVVDELFAQVENLLVKNKLV